MRKPGMVGAGQALDNVLFAAAERYGFGKVVAVKQCGRATVWLIG